MAVPTQDKVSETIAYLKKHKVHALRQLDEERQKENWQIIASVCNELRMIEKLIQTLEYLQVQ